MANLYENIEKLCKNRGINVTLMCKESGASRGSLTDLKSGRKQTLKYETLDKIASYFGISVDELVSGKQKENLPADNASGQSVIDYLRNRFSTMSEEDKSAEASDILRFLSEEIQKQNK